jgi:hypothetical protein
VLWPSLSWKQLMCGWCDQEWNVVEGLTVFGQRAEHHDVGRHLPVEDSLWNHSHHLLCSPPAALFRQLPYSDSGGKGRRGYEERATFGQLTRAVMGCGVCGVAATAGAGARQYGCAHRGAGIPDDPAPELMRLQQHPLEAARGVGAVARRRGQRANDAVSWQQEQGIADGAFARCVGWVVHQGAPDRHRAGAAAVQVHRVARCEGLHDPRLLRER